MWVDMVALNYCYGGEILREHASGHQTSYAAPDHDCVLAEMISLRSPTGVCLISFFVVLTAASLAFY